MAKQLRLGMLTKREENQSQQPPIDVDFRFAGRGASFHAIAASGNGHVEIVQGSGRINNSSLSLLTSSIVMQVVDAINPFQHKEQYTAFDCGVYAIRLVDGVATLDPLLARTDKMTVVGSGQIDLQTESLTLEWKTKPRKGLGISVSSTTNPYIRLVGTLSEPEIGFKPEEAVISTGVAVATGGISILASSFYNRLIEDPDVCETALKEVRGEAAGK